MVDRRRFPLSRNLPLRCSRNEHRRPIATCERNSPGSDQASGRICLFGRWHREWPARKGTGCRVDSARALVPQVQKQGAASALLRLAFWLSTFGLIPDPRKPRRRRGRVDTYLFRLCVRLLFLVSQDPGWVYRRAGSVDGHRRSLLIPRSVAFSSPNPCPCPPPKEAWVSVDREQQFVRLSAQFYY